MAPVTQTPHSIRKIFTDHGFDAFINCDSSVSVEMPIKTEFGLEYELITVDNKDTAKEVCGY